MSQLLKVQQKIFGEAAAATDFGQIGSKAAGTPTNTKDLATIQSLVQYDNGLSAITNAGSEPPRFEDINSMYYMLTSQIAYGFQSGIPEWDANTDYYAGVSIVNESGILYQALTGADPTPNTGKSPVANPSDWGGLRIASGVGIGRTPDSGYALDVGGKLKVETGSGEGLPSLTGSDVAIFRRNITSVSNAIISVIGGSAGGSWLTFGDKDDIDIGYIKYSHSGDTMILGTNAAEFLRGDSSQRVFIGYGNSGATPSSGADDLVIEGRSPNNAGISIIADDTRYSALYLGSTSDSSGVIFRWDYSNLSATYASQISGGIVKIGTDTNITAAYFDSYQRITLGGGLDPSTSARVSIFEGGSGSRLSLLVGADDGLSSLTNSISKAGHIGVPHFLNAEEPLTVIYGHSETAASYVRIGGGLGIGNAATAIQFYTATNTTTTTGTLAGLFDASQRFIIGRSSTPASGVKVHIADLPTSEGDPTWSTRHRLIVQGNAVTSSATSISIVAGTDGSAYLDMGDKDSADKGRIVYNNSVDAMNIWTNATRAITIDSSQRILVGLTTDISSDLLQVNGNISLRGSSDVDRTIKFASDASIMWDESEDYFTADKPFAMIDSENEYKILTKAIPIGSWNMDSSGDTSVSHGITSPGFKILDVRCRIFPDALSGNTNVDLTIEDSGTVQGSVTVLSTSIYLIRTTGGIFDSTNYDDTTINRGFVYITYTTTNLDTTL